MRKNSTEPRCIAGVLPETVTHFDFEGDGGRLEVTIDRVAKTGTLRGSEIGEDIRIVGNMVRGDVILGELEFTWLAKVWYEETGGELNPLCCFAAFLKQLLGNADQGDEGGLDA